MGLLLLTLTAGCSNSREPSDPSVLHFFQKGTQAFAAEDYQRAILHFRRALALEPTAPDIYYNLGLAYYRVGDYQAAVGAYRKAIDLDRKFSEAHYNLALAYNKLYQIDAANRHYNTYRQMVASSGGSEPVSRPGTPPARPGMVRSDPGAPVAQKVSTPRKPPNLPTAVNIKQANVAKSRRQDRAPGNPYQGKQKWWTLDPAKTNR